MICFETTISCCCVQQFDSEMAVVLDNGGFGIKIGYSIDEEPRCLLYFQDVVLFSLRSFF